MNLTKRTPYRNKKITQAADGEECTMCKARDGTTVFAHINESWAGKGMGQKADDCAGMFLCRVCHEAYDLYPWTIPDGDILLAYYRTIRRLIDRGVLK